MRLYKNIIIGELFLLSICEARERATIDWTMGPHYVLPRDLCSAHSGYWAYSVWLQLPLPSSQRKQLSFVVVTVSTTFLLDVNCFIVAAT